MGRWLSAARFRDRQQFSDKEFGETFFPGGRLGDIAVRVRRVLAKNLETDLGGIRPDDRLDDELNAGISTNVELFWQIEKEFQIDCQVGDLDVFEETASRLRTFTDLVRFVQMKIDEQSNSETEVPVTDVVDPSIDWQDVIGYSWFAGLGVWVVSSMLDLAWLMTVGLTVAFLPLTVGIACEVYQGATEIARLIRANGFAVLLREPASLFVWLAMIAPFIMIGLWLSWVLFNLYFGGN